MAGPGADGTDVLGSPRLAFCYDLDRAGCGRHAGCEWEEECAPPAPPYAERLRSEGWVRVGRRWYFLSDASSSHAGCQAVCGEAWPAGLASASGAPTAACVSSQTENGLLLSELLWSSRLASSCSEAAWQMGRQTCAAHIGLHQWPTSAGPKVGWDHWPAGCGWGDASEPMPWGGDEPNHHEGNVEDCAAVLKEGSWIDIPCRCVR